MVGAVERVDQEQQPEPDHRQEVAVDRPPGDGGDDGVGDGQSQRGDEQTHGVVNPEAAERRPQGTGQVLGHHVADRVGQQRERQPAQDVPGRDVQARHPGTEQRHDELDARQEHPQGRRTVDRERELGPFQRLAHAGLDQGPAWQHDQPVPGGEQRPAEPDARDRAAGQPGHGEVEEGEEGVPQPAEEEPLGVGVAEPPPGQPGHAAEPVRRVELDRHHQPEQGHVEHTRQGGIAVPADQGRDCLRLRSGVLHSTWPCGPRSPPRGRE